MPGLSSVQGTSQAWASVASAWSTSLNGGWIADQTIASTGSFVVNCSPSSSGYIFTSSGDGTTGAAGNGFYALGRAVRILQGSTTFYGVVASASVAAGVTTVGLSSATASGALSTGVALTSVSVGAQVQAALYGSATPTATARYHREDGTWATPPLGKLLFQGTNATFASVSGAHTVVTYTANYDPGAIYSAGKITPNVAGSYQVIYFWQFDDTLAAGETWQMYVRLNGATFLSTFVDAVSATVSPGTVVVEVVYNMNGTSDYIETTIYQNHGLNRNGHARLAVVRVQ